MTKTYIAEDLPAYDIIKDWPNRPSTDEGWAMSAGRTIAQGDDETMVRHELAMHLIRAMAGYTSDEQKKFTAASEAIVAGVDTVQISGRVYRIREEES